MENIYRTWTEFNKIQTQSFKGKKAHEWLLKAETHADQWRNSSYPQGEDWKYVKFRNLPQTSLHWPSATKETTHVADPDFITIEVKNFSTPFTLKKGSWPQGLSIQSQLEDIENGDANFFQSLSSNNPFSQSALSFAGMGLSVKFDKDFVDSRPVKLIFDLDQFTSKDLYIHFNLNLHCEENVQGKVYLEFRGESFSGLSNICVHSQVAKSGRLEVYSKEWGGPQSHSVLNLVAQVHGEAYFKCMDMTFPSLWSRHNLDVDLMEKGAEAELLGAYFNDKENFCDHHTSIRHQKPHTFSKEDYRGILGGRAQAVFNGKVFIDKFAAKSNSEQINKNLMLSKKAEVNTKPELQIYNDDVKAAHGATVGQLDEEQRFYLQSRGYSSEQAGQILAKAFVFGLLEDQSDLAKKFFGDDLVKVLSQLKES